MARINFFIFFLVLLSIRVNAQVPVISDSIVFSGIVMDAAGSRPLENVTCRYNGKGTLTNSMGQFVIHTSRRDTVCFTYIGFKPYAMVIPDSLRESEYIMGVFMSLDTVQLSEVLILRRFGDKRRQQIISLKNNMSGVIRQAYSPVKEMDADMNQRMQIDEFARKIEMKGHVDVGFGVGTQSIEAFHLLRLRKRMEDKDRAWLNYEEVDLLKKLYYLEKKEKPGK